MSSEDEECCNSGCNNCVLDAPQRNQNKKLKHLRGKQINLFDGNYRQFKLISRERCTENVQILRFQVIPEYNDTEKYMIDVPPTFHLFARAPITAVNLSKHDKNTKENYISRPYTPIRCNSQELSFDILIKYEPNGQMSEYLKALQLNDIIEWKGYYGDFMWKPNPLLYKYLVCICQGVAIAPMFSLISSILSNDDDETLIYLIVCFKDLDNYLLRNELAEFRRFWNFKSIIYLSRFVHSEKCLDKMTKNCHCLQPYLRYDETICPYRLDANELQCIYRERGSNSIMTLFCGTNELENVLKSCKISSIEIGNVYCFK